MKEYDDFDNTFNLSRIALIIIGIPIGELHFKRAISDFIENWLYYTCVIWMNTDLICGLAYLIEGTLTGTSLVKLSLTAPCAAMALLSDFKSVQLYNNKQKLKLVIEEFRKIYTDLICKEFTELNDAQDTKQSIIINDAIKTINTTVFCLGLYIFFVGISFDTFPLILMLYEYLTTGSTDFKLPFVIKYYLYEPNTILLWSLTYFHQFLSNIIILTSIFGADTLLIIFCVYIKMHFRILSLRFKNISVGENKTVTDLKKLILRHQKLIQLVELMEILFSKMTLFHIMTSSILICFNLFNITFLEDRSYTFLFFLFLVMSFTQILLVCHFGDMLMSSSVQLSQAVYSCKWYDASEATKKMLLVVLTRAQKPCKITAAGFADVNLSIFTSIISTSFSYFALLKTVYN